MFRKWPMVVYYERRNGSNVKTCGGTIIHPRFVLTAAECFQEGENGIIRAGKTVLNKIEPGEETRKILRGFRHPDYRDGQYHDDIALVKLESSLEYTDSIYPAFLPAEFEEVLDRKDHWMLGYGYRNATTPANSLHEAWVATVPCKSKYNNLVCIRNKPQQRGGCTGDSGGPLLDQRNGWWYVVGVISDVFFRVGSPKLPDCSESTTGFTRVSAFQRWILRTIQDNAD